MTSLESTPQSSSPEASPSPTPPVVAVVCEEHLCSLCSNKFEQPHVLSCLHVFCLPCLEKQLQGDSGEEENGQPAAESSSNEITCSNCKQVTTLSNKGLSDLVPDYVLSNMLDMSAVEEMQILCTSCKAKEKAVARCSDCANFLCPNCVTAHQYMRCFENHKVVSFEELQNNEVSIHKPLFCSEHSSETLKFFCHTCQLPICNECMVNDHKQPSHNYERIVDIEEKQREEMNNLITESKGKISFCEEAQSSLQNSLSDLQIQRDNAKGLIEETFQTYKALLDKKKESLLKELEEIHTSQELSVMEMCHNIDQSMEKIEHSCTFTERILNHGNDVEILAMKKMISTQLLSLINNTPKPEVNVNIEFQCSVEKFEEAVEKNVGFFKKAEEPQEVQPSSLQSSFENDGFALPSGVLSPDNQILPQISSADFLPSLPNFSKMPPMSLSTMPTQSSFVGSNGMNPPQSIIGTSIHGLGDSTTSRNSLSPAMSDSGISVDAASSGSGSNTPMINLAALAKLGSANVNPQGRMLRSSVPMNLNSTMLPGLNMNNGGSMSSSHITSRGPTPQPTDAGSAFANLLGQPSSRSQTPSLSDISALLPQGSMQNISSIGGSSSGSNSMLPSPNMTMSGGSPQNFNIGVPPPPFPSRTGRMSSMEIRHSRCKFGQLGPGKGQFNSPHGFCLGLEEDIIVADTNNHRIQVFEKSGDFKYQFGVPGREEGQLWYPRKVAVMRHSGKYVVCDRGNERSRMQIFTRNGHFIKKIAIRYIDIVAGLAITQQGHIVAVDSVSPTVFCIAETGDLLKWFDCSDYMREPSDIAISGKEYFVCDFKGHCVVVFNEEGQFLRRIGCENITNFPNGIDISDAGDVLVGDSHGNRFHVAVFQREGSLIGEFECPYVKVSRCCGLKITSEGYVVTLAKNNHHVLVLNTLYIT